MLRVCVASLAAAIARKCFGSNKRVYNAMHPAASTVVEHRWMNFATLVHEFGEEAARKLSETVPKRFAPEVLEMHYLIQVSKPSIQVAQSIFPDR